MSDDDKFNSRHLAWALGLLDSDEEREYNEIENAKANDGNERSNEEHSSIVEDSDDDYQSPYLQYALGLRDRPEESETNESDDMEIDNVLTSDDESEVSYEENESEGNEENNANTSEESQDVFVYDDEENDKKW